jgi:hypothetical protein
MVGAGPSSELPALIFSYDSRIETLTSQVNELQIALHAEELNSNLDQAPLAPISNTGLNGLQGRARVKRVYT